MFVTLIFLLRRSWFFYKEINAKSKDNNIKMELLDFLFTLYAKGECGFKDYFEAKHIKKIAVYGSGRVFNLLRDEIEANVTIGYFLNSYRCDNDNIIPTITPEYIKDIDIKVDAIIVTSVGFMEDIHDKLEKNGNTIPVIDIDEILYFGD